MYTYQCTTSTIKFEDETIQLLTFLTDFIEDHTYQNIYDNLMIKKANEY